jgi:molecular chaperone DnaJ
MTTRDLYEVLEVTRTATQEEIKASYRRLARTYHPDVNPDNPQAEDQFKEIGHAYNILSDPEKRQRYDQTGSVDDAPQDPFFQGSGAINDIFDMFFGGGGGGGQRRVGQNGEDLQVRIELQLKDVLDSVDKEMSVNRQATCPDCHGNGVEGGGQPEKCQQCGGQGVVTRMQQTFIGTVRTQTACPVCQGQGTIISNPCHTCKGRKRVPEKANLTVTIPAGVEDGSTMRVNGKGNDGIGAGRAGDLYVQIKVRDVNGLERDGQDLHKTVDVTFAQASLGDELQILGLDETYTVDLPTGCQPNDILTVSKGGLPPLHGGRRGYLYCHVNLVVPKKLNDAQRESIIKLAEAGGEQVPKGHKDGILSGLFKKKR